MLCIEFEEHLTEYLEGIIAAQVRTACHEHVMRCPVCHDLLNEVRATTQACHRLESLPLEVAPFLEANILMATAPENLMPCQEFEEHLTDYLDGFLPAAVFHRWERHAAMCASCSELPGMVVRSIGACYTSLQAELAMPAYLHDSILQATIGTTNAQEIRAPFFARIKANIRLWLDTTLAPQFAAVAAMMMVATLVGMTTISDDGSVFGMYRAGLKVARESSAKSASSAARNEILPTEIRRAAEAFAKRVSDEDLKPSNKQS